jgi:hypothetical protein
MDTRDEDIVTLVRIPLTPQDVPALEALLRKVDPFVASTIDTHDPYSTRFMAALNLPPSSTVILSLGL